MARVLTYCGEYLRTNDPDRYFLSLLTPEPFQESVWALGAFNIEIAKTREVVTDTTIGLIRLQWWRDALANVYENNQVLKHEIVESLAAAIQSNNLPRKDFDHLIYAREFDLQDVAPASLEGLLNYCDFTHTPLLALTLRCLGLQIEDAALSPIAIAYSITGLLRAMPYHAHQHRCYLPADLIEQHGVREQDIYDLKSTPALMEVVKILVQEARTKLQASRASIPYLRGMQKLAAIYLNQIEKAGYNPFNPVLARAPAFKELRVTVSALINLGHRG